MMSGRNTTRRENSGIERRERVERQVGREHGKQRERARGGKERGESEEEARREKVSKSGQ